MLGVPCCTSRLRQQQVRERPRPGGQASPPHLLHVEADCRHGAQHLANVQLVQDGGLARRIQACARGRGAAVGGWRVGMRVGLMVNNER